MTAQSLDIRHQRNLAEGAVAFGCTDHQLCPEIPVGILAFDALYRMADGDGGRLNGNVTPPESTDLPQPHPGSQRQIDTEFVQIHLMGETF